MGLYLNACVFAGIMFAFNKEPSLIVYFLAFIGGYCILHFLTPSGKENSIRKKLMIATWSRSEEGNIFLKEEVECSKVLKFLEKFPKDKKPSITHFCIKALAVVLTQSRRFLNGKIIFDKFVPYDDISVTCLVDIGGGEDLAAVTIENIDKMKIKDIQDYLSSRAGNIKKNKGDDEHRKKTQSLKLIPPFIIRLLMRVVQWISFNWGLNITPMGVKRHAFGGACITSLGMLGITDAYVPFTPFMNCPMILAVGKIKQKPVVKDGKLEIGNVISCNMTLDHRYIDGGRAKNILGDFLDVFENPEKYY